MKTNILKYWHIYIITILSIIIICLSTFIMIDKSKNRSIKTENKSTLNTSPKANEVLPGPYIIKDTKITPEDKKKGYVGSISPGDYKITTNIKSDSSYLEIQDGKTGDLINNSRIYPQNTKDEKTEDIITVKDGEIIYVEQGSEFIFKKIDRNEDVIK